ncbi:MAG TPA: PRTRC system protein D [Azonexus sp.]|nr:PRTRC system protein D [Azonexus sp.]
MQTPLKTPVVRAIDVGFGNTKYTTYVADGNIGCGMFPSIAPQAATGPDLSSGIFNNRLTVTVEVNGMKYEVGPDSRLAGDANHGRVLDPGYCLTDTYTALLRGALFYMGQPEIDLLVLGLPVNIHKQHYKELEAKFVGMHPVPLKNAKECVVKHVKVIPQPIGAFFDHSIHTRCYDRMRSQMNLLIDVGYYTLDWVVADGVKMNNARSDAENGGMSSVLQAMAKSLGDELGENVPVSLVEKAVREGTPAELYGKPQDLTECTKVGKKKAEQFVSVLANRVGSSMDISNIILAGGGAAFFKDVLQAKFPKHKIVTTADPVFANVRGFQRAGGTFIEQILNGMK